MKKLHKVFAAPSKNTVGWKETVLDAVVLVSMLLTAVVIRWAIFLPRFM